MNTSAKKLQSAKLIVFGILAMVLVAEGSSLTFHGSHLAQANAHRPAAQQATQETRFKHRYFPETTFTVRGRFLDYWDQNGGLRQQGYPISEEIQEVSEIDGKTYTVQYFERAVFEHHPENKPPYDVLLTLLGTLKYKEKYQDKAPDQKPNQSPGSVYFPQTGKRLGGSFLLYWNTYGGMAQQGYPISDEIQEKSELDGKNYTVQYFERAVMEWHPGNIPPNDVLLSHLGRFRLKTKYQALPSTSRLIAQNVTEVEAASSGPYLFYRKGDADSSSENWPLYGYDLVRSREFLITDKPIEKHNIASDGKIVVWTEARASGRGSIYSYDLSTGKQQMLLEASVSHSDSSRALAIDSGVLYYVDATEGHRGLYARDLATGNEKLIAESIVNTGPVGDYVHAVHPEIADGVLVFRKSSRQLYIGVTHDLYMLDVGDIFRQSRAEPTLLFSQKGADYVVDNYGASGNQVVWDVFQAYAGIGDVYLYTISGEKGGSKTLLADNTGVAPLVKGNTVIWRTRNPRGRETKILGYDTITKSTFTVLDVNGAIARALIRYGEQTVLAYSTPREVRGIDLYVMGLGQK